MSNNNLSFPIPNEVLEPYIRTAVSTAITAALGDGAALVEKAVQKALATKVNEKGDISPYDQYNKYDLVEFIAADNIRKITQETVGEMCEQMRPQIKEELEKMLKKQASPIAQSLVNGLMESLNCEWKINVNLGHR